MIVKKLVCGVAHCTYATLDQVLKNFFSNFTVKRYGTGKKQRYEIDYKMKEPWQGFLESGNFDCGREKRLLLDLFDYITNYSESAQTLLCRLKFKKEESKPIKGIIF